MILRKTVSTQKKDVFHSKDHNYKYPILLTVEVYWFLFIPVYKVEKITN